MTIIAAEAIAIQLALFDFKLTMQTCAAQKNNLNCKWFPWKASVVEFYLFSATKNTI